MRNLSFTIFLFFISCTGNIKEKKNLYYDYNTFKDSLNNSSQIIDDTTHTLSINESIAIIKIVNTILKYNLADRDSSCSKFKISFSNNWSKKIISQLEMEISFGMSYYSPKYDIYIGSPDSAINSYYPIDTMILYRK